MPSRFQWIGSVNLFEKSRPEIVEHVECAAPSSQVGNDHDNCGSISNCHNQLLMGTGVSIKMFELNAYRDGNRISAWRENVWLVYELSNVHFVVRATMWRRYYM